MIVYIQMPVFYDIAIYMLCLYLLSKAVALSTLTMGIPVFSH